MKKINYLLTLLFAGLMCTIYSCNKENAEPVSNLENQSSINHSRLTHDEPIGYYNPETQTYEITASSDEVSNLFTSIANEDLGEGEEEFVIDLESIIIEGGSEFIGIRAFLTNGETNKNIAIQLVEDAEGAVFLYNAAQGDEPVVIRTFTCSGNCRCTFLRDSNNYPIGCNCSGGGSCEFSWSDRPAA